MLVGAYAVTQVRAGGGERGKRLMGLAAAESGEPVWEDGAEDPGYPDGFRWDGCVSRCGSLCGRLMSL